MTTPVTIIGVASPLPQTSNPSPIFGANAAAPTGQPLSQGILPRVSWNVQPITGASVVAILFPTVSGGSFGGPV